MKYKKGEIIDFLCPLCQNRGGNKILQVFNNNDVAQHLNIKKGDSKFLAIKNHAEKIWNTDTCCFVTCLSCTFSYAIPNKSGDSEFYEMIYEESSEYISWKWEFQITFDTISKMYMGKGIADFKLLEIGAGMGNFVKKIALNLTKSENILTTEFSTYGKDKIEKLGIKCLQSDISTIKLSSYNDSFDFICMFQVLEHLNNFEVLFNHISKLIKKGGGLFISVPNNFHREFYEKHGFIEDVPPVHVGRWNKKCFDLLAKKYGYIVINYNVEPNNYLKNISKFINFKYKKFILLRTINNIKNSSLRKIFKAIIFSALLLINLKLMIVFFNKDLGIAQWVHLKKN